MERKEILSLAHLYYANKGARGVKYTENTTFNEIIKDIESEIINNDDF